MKFLESLSRVWLMAEDRPFAILSAARSHYSIEQNEARNRQLQGKIRDQGLGFFNLHGALTENAGTRQEQTVKEESFFISRAPGSNPQRLMDFVKLALASYEQEAAILKPSSEPRGEVSLLMADGSLQPVGKFHPDRVSAAYSQIRTGGKAGKTFTFESAESFSWARALIEQLDRRA